MTRTVPVGRSALLLAGLAVIVAGCGTASATEAAARCDIVKTRSGGMTVIEGVATADRAVAGTYRFEVTGPGTGIRQSGEFEAARGERVTLGTVSLGGGAAGHAVTLEVSTGGRTTICRG